MIDKARGILFEVGNIYCTANAHRMLLPEDIAKGLSRHMHGEWGEICREDAEENELSLKEGFRLMSVFTAKDGTKFWIITEADRSATTVLLPDDY